jgi:protein gp37
MADQTEIQWTDATWNPTTGCTKISPGCAHCYIERTPAFRIAGRKFDKGHIPLKLHADRLGTPLAWKKPRRVFVNSLSDLFHDDVPDAFIRMVFGVMSSCGQHTFQVLTKRPERMAAFFASDENSLSACQAEFVASEHHEAMFTPGGKSRLRDSRAINGTHGPGGVGDANYWPLPNVWAGASVEDRKRKGRIDVLRTVPAAVRFLSLEPLLEDLGELDLTGIGWVIVGGESGPGSRPCDIAWVRNIVKQCQTAGVACFVKQLGANVEACDIIDAADYFPGSVDLAQGTGSNARVILNDTKGGDMAEWPAGLCVREFPAVRT